MIAKPVGNAQVVVKYTLLPVARACHVNVTTHGAAIVIVAVPFDTEAFFPTAILPCRSGTLNVVDQSHTQYVVQIKANNVAYVVLLIADQLHRDQPDGAVHVDHILISQVILPSGAFATGIHDPSNQMKSVKPHVKNDSTPVQSVMIALFAVNPVLVPQAMLSLVLESVLIDVVFPDMSVERASRATLIAPDIDPRVNI